MLCLPYTNPEFCSGSHHIHFTNISDPAMLPAGAWMAHYCPAEKVQALALLLTSTDLQTSIFGGKPPAAEWDVLCFFQQLAYYTPRYWKAPVAAMVAGVAETMNLANKCLSYDDLHCYTCMEPVSKALDRRHWDLLCGTCFYHSDECECCSICGHSPCECCPVCQEGPPWQCDCCTYCEQTNGDCECRICRNCGGAATVCGCGTAATTLFGATAMVPWAGRDDLDETLSLPRMQECRNGEIDPLQAAADFYLLDAIKNLVRLANVQGGSDRLHLERNDIVREDNMLSALVTSAERSYRNLVDYLAPNFLAYALPAVGGELRYHMAVGKAFKVSSREGAWNRFVDIVEKKGSETLFEAAKLFREFSGGAYGGEKWGNAAKVVGMYLEGTMPAWLFVDRVFTLQHNGGCFLNKVLWKRDNRLHWGLSKMVYVLNAHAGKTASGEDTPETDWALLLQVASPEVAAMFNMTERNIGRLARRFGGTLEPVSRKSHIRWSIGSY